MVGPIKQANIHTHGCNESMHTIVNRLVLVMKISPVVWNTLALYQPMMHICRKGGAQGGGWVHPKGANSMAVSGLALGWSWVGQFS